MKAIGSGTQKVEQELKALFPTRRFCAWTPIPCPPQADMRQC